MCQICYYKLIGVDMGPVRKEREKCRYQKFIEIGLVIKKESLRRFGHTELEYAC